MLRRYPETSVTPGVAAGFCVELAGFCHPFGLVAYCTLDYHVRIICLFPCPVSRGFHVAFEEKGI